MAFTINSSPVISNTIQTSLNSIDVPASGSIVIDFAFQGGGQGQTYGYVSGGGTPSNSNIIDRFSFASDENATRVGSLSANTSSCSGQSSSTSGYISGGYSGGTFTSTITKFPFATEGTSVAISSTLTQNRAGLAGHSSSTEGFSSGGISPPGAALNRIDKFPFSTESGSTTVGTLTIARGGYGGGTSSPISGYLSGGTGVPSTGGTNRIDKFPFATIANATTVGNLSLNRFAVAGQSSKTHGYSSGGTRSGDNITTIFLSSIEKYSFSADSNSTSVGNLTQARNYTNGHSSVQDGYTTGGFFQNPVVRLNTVDKFPFAFDSNATDVGDLVQSRERASSQQV